MPQARIDVGTRSSTTASWAPYNVNYRKTKVQFIILASELSSRGISSGCVLTGISFYPSAKPQLDLSNVRIRLKETTKTSISGWEQSDMIQVYYRASIPRDSFTAGSAYTHTFDQKFMYNGGNLIVEVTRDNATYARSSSAYIYVRTGLSSNRLGGGYSDHEEDVFPFNGLTVSGRQASILDCIIHYSTDYFETIVVQQTPVKAVHFTELQSLIKEYEQSPSGANKTPSSFATITAGVTVIRSEHYNELRNKILALNPVQSTKPFPSSWPTVSAGDAIKKSQMDALRNNLKFAYQTCFICNNCENCDTNCDDCDYCDSICDYCDECNVFCDYCDDCNYCDCCYTCDYCDRGCDDCYKCDYCEMD